MTLDCPSDCPYLLQAREHEKPRSADQVDAAGLFLQVELSDQFMYEKEHLLMGLSYALAKASRADRGHHEAVFAEPKWRPMHYEDWRNLGLEARERDP